MLLSKQDDIRDLGYLQWKDPLAWMESMKGKRWEKLLETEKMYFNELISQPNVKRLARQMEQELNDVRQYTQLPGFKMGCEQIYVVILQNDKLAWKWTTSDKFKIATEIDIVDTTIWYTISGIDDGITNLVCELQNGKVLWSKKGVSSNFAILNGICYYIKVVDYFRTIELHICNAYTGDDDKIIYHELDKQRDLFIHKCSNKILYFSSSSPVDSALYRIDTNRHLLHRLVKDSIMQKPLGRINGGEDCILIKKSQFDNWKAIGHPINKWHLPNEEIEWVNIETGNLITIHEGSQTIWSCSLNKHSKPIFKIKAGDIEPNYWTLWDRTVNQSFIIKTPNEPPYKLLIVNNEVIKCNNDIKIKKHVKFNDVDVRKYYAISNDGTRVPYIIVCEKGVKPKAQLIYVYGAYGSTTPIGWTASNWYPIIKRGWAIVFALVRGGGDIDTAWAELARREHRHLSVEDFEAVIKASKLKNNLDASKTIIYGRSAGGLPVGAIVSKFPNGTLVGGAFTEVPYVDVLRTSTNPYLPLTIGEFEEFGNPAERILNFKELLSVSPINTVPIEGVPGVFVLTRVGLLDKQVFAYESFKWVQRLRGNLSLDSFIINHPKGKYVEFERKEGHQHSIGSFSRFRAIDLAILESLIEEKLRL